MTKPLLMDDASLFALIRPVPNPVWESHFRFTHIQGSLTELGADYGGLELNPDFQRGHVGSKT